MTRHFYKPIIEKIQNYDCSVREVAWLVDLFAYEVVKRLSVMMEREVSWENLENFYGAIQRDIDRFSLRVEHRNMDNKEQWFGIFKHDNKILEVIVILEKD